MTVVPDQCFTVHQCSACLHTLHPARYLCRRCHGSDWRPVTARSGTLLQFTRIPGKSADDRYLGTVQTDVGPLIAARLAGTIHDKEQRYTLRLEGDALIAAPQS